MNINRSTFRSAIWEAIKNAEERETKLGYTGPSGYRAALMELLKKTENEVSIVQLTD